MNRSFLFAFAVAASSAGMAFANCPAVTVDDPMGVPAGAFPQQYELAEFEALANCKLEFATNPDIAELNAKIRGNPELPALSERIPEEPLVYPPYHSIGKYGGTLDVLSNATEAGTSDFLSVRHVNLVRYLDDLETIVPNVAKGWEWNDDFTQLTFFLRKGHKWSDGAPFTADDVKFWYDNLSLDPKVIAKAKDYVLVAGERMEVEVVDPQTVDLPPAGAETRSACPLCDFLRTGLSAQALPRPGSIRTSILMPTSWRRRRVSRTGLR